MSEVIPVRIPQETVNDDQVLLQQWQVVDGQAVRAGQVLVEVETSKSVFEITGPAAGFIRLNAASHQEVPIGQVLCHIGTSLEAVDAHLQRTSAPSNAARAQSVRSAETSGNSSAPRATTGLESGTVSASSPTEPLPSAHSTRFSQQALALIQTHGLSANDFARRGLVRGEEVLRSLNRTSGDSRAPLREAVVAPVATPPPPASPYRSATGVPFRTEPLARSKRVETKVLSWSTQQAIRSSVTVMVPTVGRNRLLDANRDDTEQIMANIIRSTALLLREFPRLNACCLDDHVLLYEQVNIGYALDAGHGLKVAVLRDADHRTPSALIEERQRLIAAYLNQSLLPADLSGTTFTITDLSGSGVTTFDPLISEGQAGILGISGEFPVGAGQQAFHLVLSFDHRLVEGRAAASFLSQLKDLIVQFEQSLISAQADSVRETCCSRCGITGSQATTRNHFLVCVAGPQNGTTHICTICLQGR